MTLSRTVEGLDLYTICASVVQSIANYSPRVYFEIRPIKPRTVRLKN